MSEDFSQDQNRKTLRSFYCRDYLWELFEQMTRELGCSMDYLINESMRQYARSRDYSPQNAQEQRENSGGFNQSSPGNPGQSGAGGKGGPGGHANVDRMNVGQNPDMDHRTFEQVPAVGNQNRGGQQQNQGGPPGGPPPPPSPGGGGSGGGGGPQQQNQQQNNWNQRKTSRRNQSINGPQGSNRRTLFLLFNNNRYPIEGDRFVIGRGSQNTDLTIRDGNISRQHCAIIHRNNNWYLKDLGSTNGVEFRGNRIESKRIEEGDVFYLCDYPLQFTYN